MLFMSLRRCEDVECCYYYMSTTRERRAKCCGMVGLYDSMAGGRGTHSSSHHDAGIVGRPPFSVSNYD